MIPISVKAVNLVEGFKNFQFHYTYPIKNKVNAVIHR